MVRASRLVFRLAASIVPEGSSRLARAACVAGALCALAVASQASAQQPQQPASGRAIVTGVVTDAMSGAPVPGATVGIPGTPFQATTDEAGRYTLRNVPIGNHTIDAKRVGYSQAHEANVRVNAANFVHNITIGQVALSLSAITTSATVDPTSGVKSPFAVANVSMENMPVPRSGVTTNLQGKVAGLQVVRSSGATGGDEPWVAMRMYPIDRRQHDVLRIPIALHEVDRVQVIHVGQAARVIESRFVGNQHDIEMVAQCPYQFGDANGAAMPRRKHRERCNQHHPATGPMLVV